MSDATIEAIPVSLLATTHAVAEALSKIRGRADAAGIRLTAMRELICPDPYATYTPDFATRIRIFETGRP